jgi:hypothetical protein
VGDCATRDDTIELRRGRDPVRAFQLLDGSSQAAVFGICNVSSLNAELLNVRRMMVPNRGECDYLSASSFPPPFHRIAILMSQAGRFLECRDCLLSFEFPAGARHDATAKQFDSHLCRRPALRVEGVVPHRERRFVIRFWCGKA